MMMVQVEHLTKRYGLLTALDDLSLDVPRGEILALVGPNGAGKTTALKLMVGLMSPTKGRVMIAGLDAHRQPLEVKRLLGFIPDQAFLYDQQTVEEFLNFVGAIRGLDRERLIRHGTALVELFGLGGLLSTRIGSLSYGMKSRVVLIASLLHEPAVLIMDEPFFGLDPQTLRLMKQLLGERARQGMTVLLSTHQLGVAEDLAHRIAVVANGRLVAVGRLEELTRQYGEQRFEELFFQLTAPASR
jgi:ABC-2 type transport system ATP-binding protein